MRVAFAILLEVRQLLEEDPSQLAALLEEIHDEDLADLLTLLDDDEAIALLEHIDVDDAADVFERLDEPKQQELVERFGAERLAPIVSEMAADELTDLIESLPENVGDEILGTIDPEAAAEVEELIRWPEDTAGGLMTTEYLPFSGELTIEQVIQHIRDGAEEAETIHYVYAIDKGRRLLGVASIRDLLLAEPQEQLADVMTANVVTVGPETDQEEVSYTLRKYDVTALPVIDSRRRLLGLVTVDDVMDAMAEEQDEDVHKLGAVAPIEDEYFHTTFWTFVRKRAPWLAVLFFGEFIAGSIMRHYDPVLRAVGQLAHYLPLLISTGGNSGSQSASLIIRSLATGDVKLEDWWRVFTRELGQGVVLGIMLAGAGVVRVFSVGGGSRMAAVIGVTVVFIVMMGCTVGAMLPLLLRRLGLDPATSSTPFVATLVDVLGIILYFSVAQWLLAASLAAHAGH